MLDINSFTTSIKNQVLGWLSSIGTNLICPLIAAAAAIYCIFQLPQLFKAHREGTSEVFLGIFSGRKSLALSSL